MRRSSVPPSPLPTLPPRSRPGHTLFTPNLSHPNGWLTGLAAGRPDLAGALGPLLFRGPQLVARLGLPERDRLRVLDQQVDRLAHRYVHAQLLVGAARARAVERLLELLVARLRAARRDRLGERVELLVVGHLHVLRVDARRRRALPPPPALGVPPS